MYNEINDIFNEANKFFANPKESLKKPISLDVIRLEDSYEVLASLPGVKKEDISIDAKKDRLFINVKERDLKDESKYLLKERTSNYAKRSVFLKDMDGKNIKAKLENGVLDIRIPFIKEQNTQITIE